MFARGLSLIFFITVICAFFSVKYASISLLAFVFTGFVFSFLNGNKTKLFLGSIFLFIVVVSSFFIHFKQVSQNENKLTAINSTQNLEMKNRLLHIQSMNDNNADQKSILSYIYESITIAENVVNENNPESYLYLGYTYEAASVSGIQSAKEKADENFFMYCKLIKTDILKICQKN